MLKAFSLFKAQPQFQIIPSPQGETLLAIPPAPVPHAVGALSALTNLRQENLTAYLTAIYHHRFGEATFLEGGLQAIDTVLQNPPPYETWHSKGEAMLQAAINRHDWSQANWWKGFVCGLEIARDAEAADFYGPTSYGDRLLDWLARTRR